MTDEELMRDIRGIIRSGQTSPFFRSFTGGPFVHKFEKEFAKYVGSRYAVSMANGTLALNAAYTVLQCETGHIKDTALTTPWTFAATATELLRTGYDVRFCDVDLTTHGMSPLSVAQHLNSAVGLVVIMHPLGVPVDAAGIIAVCNEATTRDPVGKRVYVEDASQALGSRIGGRMCGTIANVGCFSFQMSKSLQTGEGGMCVTNSEEYHHRLLHVRNHGNKYEQPDQYPHIVSSNLRMTEITACMGLHELRRYPETLKRQRQKARIVRESFEANDHFDVQHGPTGSGDWESNGYINAARTLHNSPADGHALTEAPAHRLILKRLRRDFDRSVPGWTVGPGYREAVYELPVIRMNASGGAEVARENAEILRWNSIWVDCRKMPTETVKDLARTIEKFRE